MKNSLKCISILLFIFVLAACSKPGETGEKVEVEPEDKKDDVSTEVEALEPEEDAELSSLV